MRARFLVLMGFLPLPLLLSRVSPASASQDEEEEDENDEDTGEDVRDEVGLDMPHAPCEQLVRQVRSITPPVSDT